MPTFVLVQASFVSYSTHICILLIKCWPADLHKWVATVDCVKLDEDSGKGMALFQYTLKCANWGRLTTTQTTHI